MKVILLTDVSKLGRKYDIKDVANGYATNFLFPKKLAQLAIDSKLKEVEVLKERYAAERKVQAKLLEKDFKSLEKAEATITAKANEQGHLFQGLHTEEILEALRRDAQINLDPDMVKLPQAIKAVGEFQIPVTVGEKAGTFKLTVNPE